tara:strand:- start:12 stop:182 length:171 start_codon:yes stop_codon:yes gene_type:complete
MGLTPEEANKIIKVKNKKWDLEKMEDLRLENTELKMKIKCNIETIKIIARKYRTDK